MKQTLAYKQQKTISVTEESISAIQLLLKLASSDTQVNFDAASQTSGVGEDTFDNIFITATLKGQSKEPIRIYDGLSMADIIRIQTKDDWTKDNGWNAFKSQDVTEPLTWIAPLELPMPVLNLKKGEVLELDIRFQGASIGHSIDLNSSSMVVSTRKAVAKQNGITVIERIAMDDEYKKKYNIAGNVVSAIYVQPNWDGTDSKLFDLVDCQLQSDLLQADINVMEAATIGKNAYNNVPSGKFLPLFESTTALKDVVMEIRRNKANGVIAYILLQKFVMSPQMYQRSMAAASSHASENIRRLVS
ncbi:hypothetical protein [Aegicerativicinus sediminis]|uniref:hypothetical protein n=1 Tax=Aegicerativicinus sediminis TaxID=2893202 RepID=UPI001E5665A2|nr:hypothetical protein [Aegicerativicinus sediminis]